jgi:hypothetical protein
LACFILVAAVRKDIIAVMKQPEVRGKCHLLPRIKGGTSDSQGCS